MTKSCSFIAGIPDIELSKVLRLWSPLGTALLRRLRLLNVLFHLTLGLHFLFLNRFLLLLHKLLETCFSSLTFRLFGLLLLKFHLASALFSFLIELILLQLAWFGLRLQYSRLLRCAVVRLACGCG